MAFSRLMAERMKVCTSKRDFWSSSTVGPTWIFNTFEKTTGSGRGQCYKVGMGTKTLCTKFFWLFSLKGNSSYKGRWWNLAVKGPGFQVFLNVWVPARGLISCQFLCGLHYILFATDQYFRSSIISAILQILGSLISVCRRQLAYFSRKCSWRAPVSLFLRPGSALLLFVTVFFLWKNKNLQTLAHCKSAV